MAKQIDTDIVQTLKSRGLTCAKLKSMEKAEQNDAAKFRKAGFQNIANSNEQAAKKIRALRQQVCKLK